MQLLRDNLTLWTSSDGGENELSGESKDSEKLPDAGQEATGESERPADA